MLSLHVVCVIIDFGVWVERGLLVVEWIMDNGWYWLCVMCVNMVHFYCCNFLTFSSSLARLTGHDDELRVFLHFSEVEGR